MNKRCVVCGRSIKTGRKYCYEHRNIQQERLPLLPRNLRRSYARKDATTIILVGIFAFILGFLFLWNANGMNKFLGLIIAFFGFLLLKQGIKNINGVEKGLIKAEMRVKLNKQDLFDEAKQEIQEERKFKNKQKSLNFFNR